MGRGGSVPEAKTLFALAMIESVSKFGGGARPRDRIDHVKSNQVPRGKLWRVIKRAFICFCQTGDDITLFRLFRDDVHSYRINDCYGPISSRARQLNRDIAEVPRVSDRNVVNVALSKVTAPRIKVGPCSGKRAYQHVWYGPKVPLSRSRRAPNR